MFSYLGAFLTHLISYLGFKPLHKNTSKCHTEEDHTEVANLTEAANPTGEVSHMVVAAAPSLTVVANPMVMAAAATEVCETFNLSYYKCL